MNTVVLLAALSTAHATDIGESRRTGVGLSVGVPTAITGKQWVGDGHGLVLDLEFDPYRRVGGARAGYELRLTRFGEWHWGALDLNGQVAAAVQGGPGPWGGGAMRLGGGGGLGLSVLLAETPLEIFNELQVAAYPLSLAEGAYWAGGMVDLNGTLGVRYYF